jgi:hypothetical protein
MSWAEQSYFPTSYEPANSNPLGFDDGVRQWSFNSSAGNEGMPFNYDNRNFACTLIKAGAFLRLTMNKLSITPENKEVYEYEYTTSWTLIFHKTGI